MPPKDTIRLVLDTYVIARNAVLQRGLRVPQGRKLLVGHDATILGPIEGGHEVHLARGAHVRGGIRTPVDLVVGAGAVVEGTVDAGGNVTLLDGARVQGPVKARGRIRIVGGHVDGAIEALGDVEVGGESLLTQIQAGGRIRTLRGPDPDTTAKD